MEKIICPRLVLPSILVITGPTASGKTTLGIQLARELDAEIISADSRQIYHYFDIGTAKPTEEELSQVRHHFISTVDPRVQYSAGRFFQEASRKIMELLEKDRSVLVVGGSGLYIKALIEGIFEDNYSSPKERKKLVHEFAEKGRESMLEALRRLDPTTAETIDSYNTPRLLRALEVCRISGQPLSTVRLQKMPVIPYSAFVCGVNRDRPSLYARIECRVDQMIADGFVDEVKRLYKLGFDKSTPAMNTVGYKEISSYLSGELDFDHMVDLTKQHTRNFAKRQLTWFRKMKEIHWYNAVEEVETPELTRIILQDYFQWKNEKKCNV